LTIVAALYPILLWLSFMYFRSRSKVAYLRITRATDSFLAAPVLIALAIILGDSGLPKRCDQLYRFDQKVYRTPGKRSLIQRADSPLPRGNYSLTSLSNEYGTGPYQVHGLHSICRQAQAGFSLTIFAIVVVYTMIMVANLYLCLKPTDSTSLPLHSPSRSSRNRRARNGSTGVQTSPEMGQLPPARDSVIDPTVEPPPPYTARPTQGERIAAAPTSHPAIERVATSRTLEREGGGFTGESSTHVNADDPEDPCINYEEIEGSSLVRNSAAIAGSSSASTEASREVGSSSGTTGSTGITESSSVHVREGATAGPSA